MNLCGFQSISHIFVWIHGATANNIWLLSWDVGLRGAFAMEYDEYIRRLNHCGMSLNDSLDAIIWNCNTSLGVITAILAYAEIVLSSIVLVSNW